MGDGMGEMDWYVAVGARRIVHEADVGGEGERVLLTDNVSGSVDKGNGLLERESTTELVDREDAVKSSLSSCLEVLLATFQT